MKKNNEQGSDSPFAELESASNLEEVDTQALQRTFEALKARAEISEGEKEEALEQKKEALQQKKEALQQKKEALERAAQSESQTQKDRFESNRAYLFIGLTLFGIFMFTLGRSSSLWFNVNSELRDVQERIAVIETQQGRFPPKIEKRDSSLILPPVQPAKDSSNSALRRYSHQ